MFFNDTPHGRNMLWFLELERHPFSRSPSCKIVAFAVTSTRNPHAKKRAHEIPQLSVADDTDKAMFPHFFCFSLKDMHGFQTREVESKEGRCFP